MNADTHKGQFFTDLYIDKGKPVSDNKRFRISLYAHFQKIVPDSKFGDLADFIALYKGIKIGVIGGYTGSHYKWDEFFLIGHINDILNIITLVWKILSSYNTNLSNQWINSVNYCFREHNLIYQADEQGGVHYYQDEEFESLYISTLSCLESPRYKQIAEAFKHSYEMLNSQLNQNKFAIRSIFEAIEIMYKIMIKAKGRDRLTAENVKNKLLPIIQSYYTSLDQIARNVSQGLVNSFMDWTDSVHDYRHGQITIRTNPPLDLTILIMSLGASYLRWLVTIDSEMILNNKN